MKRISLAIVTMALAFSFVGCSSTDNSSGPAPTTVTVTAEPTPSETLEPSEPLGDIDEQYAQLIRDEISEYSQSPTADILGLTRVICEAFDDGNSFESVSDVLMSEDAGGIDAFDAGYMVGAAVTYHCPENDYMLPSDGTNS